MKIIKALPYEHSATLVQGNDSPNGSNRTNGGSLYGGKVKVPETVSIIWDEVDGNPIALQLRFPIENWTETEAQKFLEGNQIHCIGFLPATQDVKKADTDELVEAWDVLIANYQHSYDKGDKNGFVNSALFMKAVYDELTTRKDVTIKHTSIGTLQSTILFKQLDIREIGFKAIENDYKGLPSVNLVVLDKSSTPIRGILRYSLGCIIDKAKAITEENIHKVAEIFDFDCGIKTDEIVTCKLRECKAEKADKYFLPQLMVSEIKKNKGLKSFDSSISVFKTANESKRLFADKETVMEMSDKKVLNVNVDKQFGVDVSKSMSIIKGTWTKGIIYGIVYPVNEPDADGDYATPEEVQDACWRFMENYQTMNLMHSDYIPESSYAIVECACALADVNINGHTIKQGDWYIAVKIKDPDLKELIESGKISAFSMEGSALPGNPIPELEARKAGK